MWSTIATWPFSLQAVQQAAAVLSEGGSAVDAAEAGIHLVESDPQVDSVGRGGWLNAKGELELDAAMMDGKTLQIGAVAAVKGFEHPVSIARAVMEKSKHNILVGEGAEAFADLMGIRRASSDRLILPAAQKLYEENIRKAAEEQIIAGHDTIGLLALDLHGDLVAATSTSGASMKTPGRVGDSPIIGSGFYAMNGAGAAAATGLGEDIMRTCCCFKAVTLMESGMDPRKAAEETVLYATRSILKGGRKPDCIALVCMNAQGRVGADANHQGFSYACIQEGGEPVTEEVIPIIDIGGIPNEV